MGYPTNTATLRLPGARPAPCPQADCISHDSDYNPQDWRISLSEVLRIYQFYNFPSENETDQSYYLCLDEATEDGFCLGDPPSE
jgi:hypothetical protein